MQWEILLEFSQVQNPVKQSSSKASDPTTNLIYNNSKHKQKAGTFLVANIFID